MTPVLPMVSAPTLSIIRHGEETVAAFGPGGEAFGVARGQLAELLTAAQAFAERIGWRL